MSDTNASGIEQLLQKWQRRYKETQNAAATDTIAHAIKGVRLARNGGCCTWDDEINRLRKCEKTHSSEVTRELSGVLADELERFVEREVEQ